MITFKKEIPPNYPFLLQPLIPLSLLYIAILARLRLLDSAHTYPISLDLFWGYFVFSLLVACLAWLHKAVAQPWAESP